MQECIESKGAKRFRRLGTRQDTITSTNSGEGVTDGGPTTGSRRKIVSAKLTDLFSMKPKRSTETLDKDIGK
ncbi:hypothetical protein PsorP6_001006 [Peronosclerospora sorghi]|uniref:Uncharacterized protein n=1 Tax=Peronosclerospora sorghi TaxID=230839 RepID=A0ACC0WSC5_9STRA|nr:hypothetical protein PsorP6_001006 [Peronosclerospora sorghi]